MQPLIHFCATNTFLCTTYIFFRRLTHMRQLAASHISVGISGNSTLMGHHGVSGTNRMLMAENDPINTRHLGFSFEISPNSHGPYPERQHVNVGLKSASANSVIALPCAKIDFAQPLSFLPSPSLPSQYQRGLCFRFATKLTTHWSAISISQIDTFQPPPRHKPQRQREHRFGSCLFLF